MADPFATPSDIAAAWRALTAAETLVASTQLAFASAIIRNEISDVDARITAGTLDPDLVKGVAVAMVVRRLQNPDGYRSVQEGIEDYTTTRTRDTALSSGEVYLSEIERSLLTRRGSNAFSITPAQEPTTFPICEQVAAHRAGWDR